MYDIDLFTTPQATIDLLHAQGRKVICYFSAGSYENFRDDAAMFPKKILGKKMQGWNDEKWLDVGHFSVFAPVMQKRLDLAVTKKCDGVDPDNMDGYQNKTGFKLTYNDQLQYAKWIAKEAHARGLAVGLKNNIDQIADLVMDFDFAVNEQCFQYKECDKLLPFIKQNKPVFGVEYQLKPQKFCSKALAAQFSTLKMELALKGKRIGCEIYVM